ncbi:MAG: hypothetical protein AMK74_03280 [Nitrospira bacterium SM23_35]|jgi:hypothetical protein|nr:MAG: hypothetical protein AMK74_03280 [Nitrospira bacterium SM23_35]
MTYNEAIKGGVRVVNRNWQLVLIQLSVVFISSIGFFIIVGIPLAIAFIIFGVDLTEMADLNDIIKILKGPSDILSKYFGLFLIVLASLLLYLILIALLGIYVFGGSIGIIGRSLRDSSLTFHVRAFFEEAKRLFLRLLAFTSFIGIVFIIVAFVLGILGGGIAALVSYAQTQDSTLALFIGTFFSLIMIIMAAILILGILSITLYGIASLSFKETGPVKSIQEAWQFMTRHPDAFWLYTILFGGYLLASFLLVLFSYPFALIPIIGTILSFPYQLISYAFETYLGLIIIAAMLNFYYSMEIQTVSAEPDAEGPVQQPAE